MLKNRLSYIPDELFHKYMNFSSRHREIIKAEYMLQKLIIFDFIIPILSRYPSREILEIGCGQGIHASLLSDFGRVHATELKSPGSFVGAEQDVEHDRSIVFNELPKSEVAFTYNNGRTLPYPDSSFDIIFHNSVIEHVPDPILFNREVGRVLKPNGVQICITGTSTLCLFRLLKDYILKFPLLVLYGLYREMMPSKKVLKINDKFKRIATKTDSDVDASKCTGIDFRSLYPKLINFIANPDYNQIIIEDIAKSYDLSVQDLIYCIERHFDRSIVNRFFYYLTPRTHGQHYKNYVDEMMEWRLSSWENKFVDAGFNIEEIIPYRYHHVLEIFPTYKLDTLVYFYFARLIQRINKKKLIKPSLASEFILVARKPTDA
jgi:SAM-dependent methyltransferase